MNPVETEFRRIEEIWDALETGLESQYQAAVFGGAPDPVPGAELQNMVERVAEAAARMSQFADRYGAAAKDSRWEETRRRGRHILVLIERNASHFRRFRSGARESLAGVRSGEQFLHSMRHHGSHAPKFIDACQ